MKNNIGYRFAVILVSIMVLSGCSSKDVGSDGVPDTGSVDVTIEEPTPGFAAEENSLSPTPVPTPPLLAGSTPYSSVIKNFILSIKNNDAESLKQMISPSGLIVIRNFSSGFGTRGKDIRYLYSVDEIPDTLQFEVADEIPIILHEYFTESQQSEVSEIPVTKINDRYFGFSDDIETRTYGPPTDEVANLCSELTSDCSPVIFELGEKEVVFTESESVDYTPVGVWAVFEKQNDAYWLRAIIDLR